MGIFVNGQNAVYRVDSRISNRIFSGLVLGYTTKTYSEAQAVKVTVKNNSSIERLW